MLGINCHLSFSLTLAYLINFFALIFALDFQPLCLKNVGVPTYLDFIVAFMSREVLIPLAFFPKVVSDILSFLPSLIYTFNL